MAALPRHRRLLLPEGIRTLARCLLQAFSDHRPSTLEPRLRLIRLPYIRRHMEFNKSTVTDHVMSDANLAHNRLMVIL